VPALPDVVWSVGRLTRRDRWRALGMRGATVWFTGLSGSGKSTLAAAVEEHLVANGRAAYRLDGDNVRSGLNEDLGFAPAEREENIRRVAHVARLFADAGVVALAALISPYAEGRRQARALHEDAGLRFVEVYVDTPVELCASRDPKGLYARAMAGEVPAFTGVSDPYEPPERPEVVIEPNLALASAVDLVLEALGFPCGNELCECKVHHLEWQ